MNDLDGLIADLGEVPVYVGPEVKRALAGTAFNMKESWREAAAGPSGGHAKGYPHAIDYEVSTKLTHHEALIGPDLNRRQGALGILEDAPGGVSAAPQNLRPRVIRENEADFERGMTNAVDDALRRAGL